MNKRLLFLSAFAFVTLLILVGCGPLGDALDNGGLEPKHGTVSVDLIKTVPASDTLIGFGDTAAIYAQISYTIAQTSESFSRSWTISPANMVNFSRGDTLFIIAPGYKVDISVTIEASISSDRLSYKSILVRVLNLAVPDIRWTGISDNQTVLQTTGSGSLVFSIGTYYQYINPLSDSIGFEFVNQNDSVLKQLYAPGRSLTYGIDLTTLLGAYKIYAHAWSCNASQQKVEGKDTVSFIVNAVDILPKQQTHTLR